MRFGAIVLALGVLLAGCEEPAGHDDHAHGVELAEGQLVDVHLERAESFRQVGLIYDAPDSAIWFRVGQEDTWSAWSPVDVTWSEDKHHIGRVILEAPAKRIELRSDVALEMGYVEFFAEVVGAKTLTRDLPFAQPTANINAIAPASLVIPRAEWGARDPNKVCGAEHQPYRISIHHTAQPSDDGPDAAARLRQMQAYHIDNRGWCDIGYHFVVSQGGKIYQGRSDEMRLGAHVGGQNAGNIGISMIGNFEEQTPSQTQLDATIEILAWVANTYNIPYNRDVIKGHRQWPGQTTSCPGKNIISRLDTMIEAAGGATLPPSTDTYDVDFNVTVAGDDVYQSGSSTGVVDAFVGDVVEAEIRITNNSTVPLRGVVLGYGLDAEFVAATDYRIETDYPALDGQTFVLNDANDAPENPEKSALGEAGTLVMYAFGPGETKRVVVSLEVLKVSIGEAKPALRAWPKAIEEAYEQAAFGEIPTLDRIGRQVQGAARVDVLSRDQWQFNGTDADETEGWVACGNGTNVFRVSGGSLELEGVGVCAESPAWTRVDPAAYHQLVVNLSQVTGDVRGRIHWVRDEDDRFVGGLVFDLNDDLTHVIAMDESEFWNGSINGLRLTFEGEGTVGIDSVFFQNNDETSSSDPVEDKPPTSTNVPDRQDRPQDELELVTSDGCSSTPTHPVGSLGILLIGVVVGLVRRRV